MYVTDPARWVIVNIGKLTANMSRGKLQLLGSHGLPISPLSLVQGNKRRRSARVMNLWPVLILNGCLQFRCGCWPHSEGPGCIASVNLADQHDNYFKSAEEVL